jgi:hypothetical protein
MLYGDSCLPCPRGKYQKGKSVPSIQVDQCNLYRHETYQSWSPTQCTLCPRGTFQAWKEMTNRSQCLACGIGAYQPLQGQISGSEESCLHCSDGIYLSLCGVSSSSGCRLCKEGCQTATGISREADCTSCGTWPGKHDDELTTLLPAVLSRFLLPDRSNDKRTSSIVTTVQRSVCLC